MYGSVLIVHVLCIAMLKVIIKIRTSLDKTINYNIISRTRASRSIFKNPAINWHRFCSSVAVCKCTGRRE